MIPFNQCNSLRGIYKLSWLIGRSGFTDIRDREWLSVCFDLQSKLLNVTNLDNQKTFKVFDCLSLSHLIPPFCSEQFSENDYTIIFYTT